MKAGLIFILNLFSSIWITDSYYFFTPSKRKTVSLFALPIRSIKQSYHDDDWSISVRGGAIVSADNTTTTHGNIIEENPDYVPLDDDEYDNETDDETDNDSDDDSEYDDQTDDESTAMENPSTNNKSILNKQLLSTSNSKISKTIKFIQAHRTIITIMITLYAFRREISNVLYHICTTTSSKDDKERKWIRIRINPTSILKIILFIDFMRKILGSNNYIPSDSMSGLEGGGSAGGSTMIGTLIKDLFFMQSNSAFIPPVEQHYTFEIMNDRFGKDENAWNKANSLGDDRMLSSVSVSPLSKVSLFHRSSSSKAYNKTKDEHKSNETQNIPQNHKSIVVMEMKVDTNVNSMPLIRDQISFLIHQHRANNKKLTEEEENKHTTAISNKSNITTTITTCGNYKDLDKKVNDTTTIATSTSLSSPSQLEVIILLESPGGSATDYGLASYQIARLRNEPGIKVTICVDKVAASGGYMMACMASPGQLYAAPFAMLGSIGVYGQTLNIHNTLQNWGVKPLVFRGGKDKAPVGLVGEITKEGIAKVQGMIDKTHSAFKRHVVEARPILAHDIDNVATGDVWLGHDALDIGLVDEIKTSDEYIWNKIQNGDRILKLIKFQRPRLGLFGGPRSSSGLPGLHSLFSKVSEMMTDFKNTLQKVNDVLESIPNDKHDNDITKFVHV